MTVSQVDIVRAIRHLDLERTPVCIHCSVRSFGELDGGPRSVVDAFLSKGATVLVPTFSWSFFVVPPQDQRPRRNGSHYQFANRASSTSVYTMDSPVIDDDMGALAATVLTYHTRHRGLHPLCSFAAVGPLARELISRQGPNDVWAPLKALVEHNGAVLLMGVDLTKLTLGHLAEERAGRRSFVRWALDASGTVASVEVGGCSEGYSRFGAALSPLVRSTQVGRSRWTCLLAKESLYALVQAISDQPMITQCADSGCERCRDAVAGGPLVARFGA